MRGFFANLVAFGCLFLLLAIASQYPDFSSRHQQASLSSLEIQKNYYRSLDFKHAFMEILSSSKSAGDREEIIAKIAERSAELEQFIERDAEVDVWCGIVTEAELRALPARMMRESRPLKCRNCWDFSKKTVILNPREQTVRQARVCSSFFDYDPLANKAGISMGGLALNPSPEVLPSIYSGKSVIGISIYDSKTNSSYVGILEGGTWAD